ncbi:14049_t:CDS:1, partial [Racocetra fulgida]
TEQVNKQVKSKSYCCCKEPTVKLRVVHVVKAVPDVVDVYYKENVISLM